MKRAAFLILLCAAAVPAAAVAQTADAPIGADDSLLTTKWTLKQPRKRVRPGQTAQADVQGPKKPAPMRMRVPPPPPKPAFRNGKPFYDNSNNAAGMVASIIQDGRNRGN